MRIFYAKIGDPMLLDTVGGLRSLYDEFASFLASSSTTREFPAQTNGSPAPYDRFLAGLRVHKGDNKTQMRITSDGWIELQGNSEELEQFKEQLLVEQDCDHKHWYSSPISLIIEADESWPGEEEN